MIRLLLFVCGILLLVSLRSQLYVRRGRHHERRRTDAELHELVKVSHEHLAVGRGLMMIRWALCDYTIHPVMSESLGIITSDRSSPEAVVIARRNLLELYRSEYDTDQLHALDEVVEQVQLIRQMRKQPYRVPEVEKNHVDRLFDRCRMLGRSLHGTGMHIELSLPQLLVVSVISEPSDLREALAAISNFAMTWGNFDCVRSICAYLIHRPEDLRERFEMGE